MSSLLNRSKTFLHPRNSRGVTLIEVLISLTVSLILISATTTLFVRQHESVRYVRSMARIQEDGRFALDMLFRNFRMSRYDDKLPVDAIVDAGVTGGSGITGFDAPGGTGLSTIADTVITQYEGGTGILDCLGRQVDEDETAANTFAIDDEERLICTSRHYNQHPLQSPLLFPAPLTGTLVEGVEDMQLLYGEDLTATGIPNRFVTADDVTDWDGVVSVRVSLLVNSVTPVTFEAESVCMACTLFDPAADRRTRGEFTTSIGIRNKNF